MEKINQSHRPSVRVNPELNKYDNIPMFQDKVDMANEILRKVGVPDLYIEKQDYSQDALILQINDAIHQIKKYDMALKQTIQLGSPLDLIEKRRKKKAQLVADLITLMAEMDVNLEVKQAVHV